MNWKISPPASHFGEKIWKGGREKGEEVEEKDERVKIKLNLYW
jgi:hypothetical protein